MSDVNMSKGGQNRFYMWCSEFEQKRAYGSCLCVKDGYDAGRLTASDPNNTCAASMSKGNCVAVKMREEELEAGKALYFTESRPKSEVTFRDINAEGSESYQRGWNQVGKSMGESQPVVRKTVAPMKMRGAKGDGADFGSVDMGALITSELKKEADNRLQVTQQLADMKREIMAIAKSDPAKARALIVKAKILQESIG